MRVRELHAWLDRQGWERVPEKGGSTVTWRHRTHRSRRLTYHVPHGTDARELRPDVVRAIRKKLATLEGRESDV